MCVRSFREYVRVIHHITYVKYMNLDREGEETVDDVADTLAEHRHELRVRIRGLPSATPQSGSKSAVLRASICATRRKIPACVSTNQGP